MFAWKASCAWSVSSSTAVSREGIILERLVELVDVAEEGLWPLYAATWASDLAVSARPGRG